MSSSERKAPQGESLRGGLFFLLTGTTTCLLPEEAWRLPGDRLKAARTGAAPPTHPLRPPFCHTPDPRQPLPTTANQPKPAQTNPKPKVAQ